MNICLYPGRRTPPACLPWAVMSRPFRGFCRSAAGRCGLTPLLKATVKCIGPLPRPEGPLHKSPGQAARGAAPPWVRIHKQGALKGRHITAFHHNTSHITVYFMRGRGLDESQSRRKNAGRAFSDGLPLTSTNVHSCPLSTVYRQIAVWALRFKVSAIC